jgi:hypothetical protein
VWHCVHFVVPPGSLPWHQKMQKGNEKEKVVHNNRKGGGFFVVGTKVIATGSIDLQEENHCRQ